MGVVYHLIFFRQINPAAALFGIAFLLQGVLFAVGALKRSPQPDVKVKAADRWVGGALLAYGLALYPLLGWALGRRYPANPTFGLPCPTTLATLGLLLWLRPRPPSWLLVIPLLWVAVGTNAAFTLGMHEDLGLLIAGIAATARLWHRSRHESSIASAAAS
ncbi:MAG: hypothetical protein HY700_10205 [Gemmatimonadetes bacterium]|nr:hypothetical protein [Gemmatimonadota bacterium]